MRISKSPLNLFEVFEEKLSSIIDKIKNYQYAYGHLSEFLRVVS